MRFPFAPIALVGLLAACSGGSDIFIPVPPHSATPGVGALAQGMPGDITVALFDDTRPAGRPSGWVGERRGLTSSRAPNQVYLAPPPGLAVREAVVAELTAAGWHVRKDATNKLEGEVSLSLDTEGSTTSTWTVTVATQFHASLRTNLGERSGSYQARCQDRSLSWPSESMMGKVISRCVDDVVGQFRDDTLMARALGAP